MASTQTSPWSLGFRALGETDLAPLISNDPFLSARASSPTLWTLGTCHGTTLYYDPQNRICMHAESPQDEWCALHLWSADGVHGLLLPDCADAADHAKPVRIRFISKTKCALLCARCGLEEVLYSAKPPGGPWLPCYVEEAEHIGEWETLTAHPAASRTGVNEKSLRALSELIEERPAAAEIVGRQTDATALRWFLALQDFRYVDALGSEAVEQPGRAFIRRLGAGARQPAVRYAYESLAEWLEDRDTAEIIEHIGPDFDIFDPFPGWTAFSIDIEILARLRQHVAPRKGACVLATLRNEGPYILEWLAYHKALGFEHFFIYTNANNDDSDDLLAELAAQGHITLITNDARKARPQLKAYGHAFKALAHILDYEWALVIDGDEFLVLAQDGRFPDINHYVDWLGSRPVDAVGFNWLMFLGFGIEEAELEKPVTRRFVRRANAVNDHIKTMVKPRYFIHSQAHYPFNIRGRLTRYLNSNGDLHLHGAEKAHSTKPVADAAWINHYWTKSAQEFCGKWARNGGDLPSSFVRPLSEVEQMLANMQKTEANQKPVEDRRIWGMLEPTERLVGELLADPAIRAAHEATIANQRRHLDALMQQVSEHRRRKMEAQSLAAETAASAAVAAK